MNFFGVFFSFFLCNSQKLVWCDLKELPFKEKRRWGSVYEILSRIPVNGINLSVYKEKGVMASCMWKAGKHVVAGQSVLTSVTGVHWSGHVAQKMKCT